MSTVIKIGVVGAGVFGSYHAAKYAARDDAALTAVFDLDGENAVALAAKHGAEAISDFRRFLDKVDAVVIAAPASAHFQIAEAALKAGRHVFVEKPLALTLASADALIALADEKKCVLQVGHQERYVCEAVGLLSRDRSPLRAECVRRVPFSGRCDDVSVAFDLMVHDLDIVRQLTKSDAANIRADGGKDEIAAELFLENGTLAVFNAGRRAKESERRMTLIYDDGVIEFDFIRRRLKNSTAARLDDVFAPGAAPLAVRDPLAHGAELFIEAVRGGETPVVSGRSARTAVAWAHDIEQAAGIETASSVKRLRA